MPKLSTLDISSKLLIPSSFIKKFLKNEIQLNNYVINIKDEKKEDKKKDKNYISVGNSQYVLTKSIETMIKFIISETIIDLNKSKLGLYELSYIDIENAIYKNDELKNNFLSLILNYNSDIQYNVLENKDLINFIDSINENMKINIDAINFIQYLINYYCCRFLKIAYVVMNEYNKLRINSTIITICWKIMFIGRYQERIIKEMENIIRIIDKIRKEKKDKKEEEKQNGGENNDKGEIENNNEEGENKENDKKE